MRLERDHQYYAKWSDRSRLLLLQQLITFVFQLLIALYAGENRKDLNKLISQYSSSLQEILKRQSDIENLGVFLAVLSLLAFFISIGASCRFMSLRDQSDLDRRRTATVSTPPLGERNERLSLLTGASPNNGASGCRASIYHFFQHGMSYISILQTGAGIITVTAFVLICVNLGDLHKAKANIPVLGDVYKDNELTAIFAVVSSTILAIGAGYAWKALYKDYLINQPYLRSVPHKPSEPESPKTPHP